MEILMWAVLLIIMIIIAIIWFSGTVLGIKDKIKEEKQKKIEENEKAEQKILLENVKKMKDEEIARNSSVDLSTLPFAIEFKKEFGIEFMEFKKSLNKIELCASPKSYNFNKIKDVFMYNDKYFYLYNTMTNCDEKDLSYQLMGDDEKTNSLIDLYKNTKLSEFKKNLYSLDDLLYVVGSIDKEEHVYKSLSQPSKSSLALTEGIFGTAAAMKKLNDSKNNDMVFTSNNYIYKFIFSEKTNLPVMYNSSTISPSSIELKLYNTKTYERYQERQFNKSLEKKDDELKIEKVKKYKELLDCGAITQEEFEKKKKELLNL